MNLTYGEHRASDQNTTWYQPPLERLPPFRPWPLWKLALNALGAATVFLLICVGLPAAWGG